MTHNTMCKLLHNSVELQEKVYVMSSVCEAEKRADEVCVFVPLHKVEAAPMIFQRHGRTSVSGPVGNHSPKAKVWTKMKSAAEHSLRCPSNVVHSASWVATSDQPGCVAGMCTHVLIDPTSPIFWDNALPPPTAKLMHCSMD